MYCITNIFDDSLNCCECGTIFLDIEESEECTTINNDTTETLIGVLAVEAQQAKTIDMDEAIDDFAVRKARRNILGKF